MTYRYSQSTGVLTRDGAFVVQGYCGKGRTLAEGRNNPDLEAVQGVGPIPRGRWIMTGIYDSSRVGPRAIILEPQGHNAHGRRDFRFHGNNQANDASRGCIIIGGRALRQSIWDSGDHTLEVVR